MLSGSRIFLLFALPLFLSACGDTHDGKIISRYYYSAPDSSIYFKMFVDEDSLSLDIPNTLMGYDSVLLYFPASKKEVRGSGQMGEYFNKFQFKPKRIIQLFDLNDSIQVIFKKKNTVIFRPILYKSTDTIVPGGGGMIKLCQR